MYFHLVLFDKVIAPSSFFCVKLRNISSSGYNLLGSFIIDLKRNEVMWEIGDLVYIFFFIISDAQYCT